MYLNNEEEENNLALTRFESMLRTNKILFFDSEEFENIIFHYLDSGKLNLAKKALKLGLEQHPNSTGLKLVEVEILIFQDKLEIADRLLNELQEIEPHNDEIYVQRANIFSKKGNHHSAIQALQKALTLTDDFSEIYSLLGMEYLFIDEIEKAKENFILYLEQDDEDHSALYNVVYCFDFLNQNTEAIEFLNHFIDKKPYSEIAWHQLGRQYFILKDFEKAVWAFDYAILIDEYFLGAYLEKGKSLEKLQRYQEAIDNYMITIELDAPSSYVLMRIGHCYEELENDTMALQYFKRTVHEDPMLDKGWIALTDVCIKRGEFEKALFYLQKAIQIDELNEKYWIRYAVLNKSLMRFEEAEKGYKQAAELGSYVLEHWIGWADVLYVLGDYEIAIQKLLQILEFYPDDALIAYRLAVLYFTIHEPEKGTYHLTIALNKDYEQRFVIQTFFPAVWEHPMVQNIIQKHTTNP